MSEALQRSILTKFKKLDKMWQRKLKDLQKPTIRKVRKIKNTNRKIKGIGGSS